MYSINSTLYCMALSHRSVKFYTLVFFTPIISHKKGECSLSPAYFRAVPIGHLPTSCLPLPLAVVILQEHRLGGTQEN